MLLTGMTEEFKDRKQRLYDYVVEILTDDVEARESNANIVRAVYRSKVSGSKRDLVDAFFEMIEQEKLPAWESITRERRYATQNNPELKGSEEAEAKRQQEFDNQYERARSEK